MKNVQCLFLAILGLLGLSIALPQPHTGMVDTATIRDVGLIYGETDFKGPGKLVFEIKAGPKCLPLNTGVVSIKICKSDAACTFYTVRRSYSAISVHKPENKANILKGGGCDLGPSNYAVRIGCGDFKDVKTPVGSFFTNYACGHADFKPLANMTLKTTSHDSRNDSTAMLI
ncbi:hypothetical protein DE146DRAFT_771372 [Phaeosphaeria sp. MPI-PUGE-AT-0046c]|nr:hypothetical protein DE146DRAFT_771372 [Phaeosphaeria sp. MPI-PUGE-AT-0046c]